MRRPNRGYGVSTAASWVLTPVAFGVHGRQGSGAMDSLSECPRRMADSSTKQILSQSLNSRALEKSAVVSVDHKDRNVVKGDHTLLGNPENSRPYSTLEYETRDILSV